MIHLYHGIVATKQPAMTAATIAATVSQTRGLLRAVAGVALIGAVNLTVSFSLALWVALRSRGVSFTATTVLLPELWQRVRTRPSRFFVPEGGDRDESS